MRHRELITEILDGETHRFSEIVDRFDDRVRGTIMRRLRDCDACEELVQETFYRAFRNLDQLADPTRLEAWLTMIARRCVTDHYRKIARNRELPDCDPVEQPEAACRWVWDEVEQLGTNFSEVLILRYQGGMSYEEIAVRLGVSKSTIRGRIYEARLALRRRLDDKELLP